jgi:hypothetical protein
MIWVLLSGAMMIAGIALFNKGRKLVHEVKRYEFENRTDGGVVKFQDYDASVEHRKKKGRAGDAYNLGAVMMGVGGVFLAIALLNVMLGG